VWNVFFCSRDKNITTIHCDECLVVIKVANYLLFNVYFPCSGTTSRSIICENLLSDIEMWRDRYGDCECVFAGDLNCDFDGSDAVSLMVQNFIHDGSFTRCDNICDLCCFLCLIYRPYTMF